MRGISAISSELGDAIDAARLETLPRIILDLILLETTDSEWPLAQDYRELALGSERLDGIEPQRLLAESKRLDERYFDLQDQGEPDEVWSPYFRGARLFYALSVAATAIDAESVDTIVYELAYASDDIDRFVQRVLPLARRDKMD